MTSVAIIGAGPLGRWLALAAARAGFRVLLEDVMPVNLHHAQEYLRGQFRPTNGDRAGEPMPAPAANPAAEARCCSGPETAPGATRQQSSAVSDASLPVTFVASIEDAVREADLAIDCVPDELESKLEILWLLDRMAPPRTVLVTPTAKLSIADLASCTYRPEKCLAVVADARTLAGIPAAEILLHTTLRTAPDAVDLVRTFWERLGFVPRFEQVPA